MPFNVSDEKEIKKAFGIITLAFAILYTVIVCAVPTQEINPYSNEQKYINERRAYLGLKWMTVPVLIIAVVINAYAIYTL